jgi:hypothetical protein
MPYKSNLLTVVPEIKKPGCKPGFERVVGDSGLFSPRVLGGLMSQSWGFHYPFKNHYSLTLAMVLFYSHPYKNKFLTDAPKIKKPGCKPGFEWVVGDSGFEPLTSCL